MLIKADLSPPYVVWLFMIIIYVHVFSNESCQKCRLNAYNQTNWSPALDSSWNEPPHDKTNCAPSEDSDQPWHPPSLIRVFAVCMKKAWVLSYPLSGQRRLWSDRADAQAELSLRWAPCHFVGFVMRRLKLMLDLGLIGSPEHNNPDFISFVLYYF